MREYWAIPGLSKSLPLATAVAASALVAVRWESDSSIIPIGLLIFRRNSKFSIAEQNKFVSKQISSIIH